nr:hypothetical protein Iba_chr13eCG11500 [Ipomoea batatas]
MGVKLSMKGITWQRNCRSMRMEPSHLFGADGFVLLCQVEQQAEPPPPLVEDGDLVTVKAPAMERAENPIEANDRNLEEDRIANLRTGEISRDNMRAKCQEINKILKAEQVKVQVEEDETESSRRDGKDPVMPEDKNREDAGKERLKEVKFVETPKENTDGAFAETPFGPSRKVEGTNVVRGVMKPIEERDFVGNSRSNGASVSGTKPSDDGYSEREKVWKTGENRKETDCPTGVCENVKETIQKPVNMNKGTGPATSKGPGQSKKENLPNTTETGRRNKQENVGDAQRGQQHDNIGVKGGKTGKSEGAEEVASGENENKKEKVSEKDQEFKYGYAKSAKEADKKKKSIDGEEEKETKAEENPEESKGNKKEIDEETESPARSRASEDSSEYTEIIKVRLGDVELPMSPSLLDELMERSKKGERDMETLILKHVMDEISKAIKRKTMAMADSCKLEAIFANEVESKLQELSKPKEQSEQGNGVMKPMKERDYSIPLSPKNIKKTNIDLMNAKDERMMNGAKLEQEGKRNQENTKAKLASTGGVCENVTTRNAGTVGGNMTRNQQQGMGGGQGRKENVNNSMKGTGGEHYCYASEVRLRSGRNMAEPTGASPSKKAPATVKKRQTAAEEMRSRKASSEQKISEAKGGSATSTEKSKKINRKLAMDCPIITESDQITADRKIQEIDFDRTIDHEPSEELESKAQNSSRQNAGKNLKPVESSSDTGVIKVRVGKLEIQVDSDAFDDLL